MLLEAWLFVGAVAILATGAAVLTPDDGAAILFGVAGFVAWGMWAFGTLNVEAVGDSVVFEFEMPALTILGVMLAMIPGYVALTGPMEIISRVRETEMQDV